MAKYVYLTNTKDMSPLDLISKKMNSNTKGNKAFWASKIMCSNDLVYIIYTEKPFSIETKQIINKVH